jgi:hypothetical protein
MSPRTKAQQRSFDLREERRSHDPVPDSDKCLTCGGYIGNDPQHAWLTRCVCALRKGETGVAAVPDATDAPSGGEGESPHKPSSLTPINDSEPRGRLNRQVRAGDGGPDSQTAATSEGEPMPETQLPVTEGAARPMFAPLETTLGGLLARHKELQGKPLTRMIVETAKELDDDAKKFLAAAEQSDARKAVDNAYGVHRFLSRMFKTATDPAQEVRRFCSGLMAKWETERRMEADRQRREREEAARKEQERIRAEEAAALKKAGHKEEAKELLKAPLPPVALPDELKPTGKVSGMTVIEVFKFDRIVDAKLLAQYLVEHPEDLLSLFEVKAGEWKRRATAAKGTWNVPGVVFSKDTETRNRG